MPNYLSTKDAPQRNLSSLNIKSNTNSTARVLGQHELTGREFGNPSGSSVFDNYNTSSVLGGIKGMETRDSKQNNQASLLNKVLKKSVRASYEGRSPLKTENDDDFLPSLGQSLGESKTNHGRNHKEAETLPPKTSSKF